MNRFNTVIWLCMWIYNLLCRRLFSMFTALSREVIARFIELDGIADHH